MLPPAPERVDTVTWASYRTCRKLNAIHGRTYFLATRLLTPAQRPAVHALYGFARWVDDLVDDPLPGTTPATTEATLESVAEALRHDLGVGGSAHPILAAVVDTARRHDIDPGLFDDFLTSMRMDLTVRRYPDRSALECYTRGSAEAIGLQVLPVLGTVTAPAEAAPAAAALGQAFQLTNFLRDVAEDFERGRIYLPLDELAVAGVTEDTIAWCVANRRPDARVRRALADQIAVTRAVYRRAERGIAMLAPVSRPCVRTAATLYGEILDCIEAAGHDVFTRRATVGKRRRATVAAGGLARAAHARMRVR